MIPCPTCRRKGPWRDLPHTPFCSERCKLVDLGKWLGEEYRISSPLAPEHFEGMPDSEEPEG